jgi:hypothetical protein
MEIAWKIRSRKVLRELCETQNVTLIFKGKGRGPHNQNGLIDG